MNNFSFKAFFEKIKSPLLDFFYLALAIFFLSLILLLRFLPRTARDLWETLSQQQFISILITIVIIFINIYNTLKILGIIKTKRTFSVVEKTKAFLIKYSDLFLEIMKNFYDFCWYIAEFFAIKIFNYKYLKYYSVRRLAKSFNNPTHFPYYFIILMCLKFLPRIIFVLVFFIEAIIYNHLDMTFRCIPFLLLIFLEEIFIFIIEDFYDSNYKDLSTCVREEKYTNAILYYYKPGVRKEYPYGATSGVDYVENHFMVARRIPLTLFKYEAWKVYKSIFYYLTLLLQIIRLLTYIYILLYTLV